MNKLLKSSGTVLFIAGWFIVIHGLYFVEG